MTLSIEFCEEAMGCDQVRTPEGDFTTCNLTGNLVYGMAFGDCPKVQQELAKARTEGRQQAAAELDRSAGQLMQTYVQKQSLIHLLTHLGCQIYEDGEAALRDGRGLDAKMRHEQEQIITHVLKIIIAGTSLKEVEL